MCTEAEGRTISCSRVNHLQHDTAADSHSSSGGSSNSPTLSSSAAGARRSRARSAHPIALCCMPPNMHLRPDPNPTPAARRGRQPRPVGGQHGPCPGDSRHAGAAPPRRDAVPAPVGEGVPDDHGCGCGGCGGSFAGGTGGAALRALGLWIGAGGELAVGRQGLQLRAIPATFVGSERSSRNSVPPLPTHTHPSQHPSTPQHPPPSNTTPPARPLPGRPRLRRHHAHGHGQHGLCCARVPRGRGRPDGGRAAGDVRRAAAARGAGQDGNRHGRGGVRQVGLSGCGVVWG